MGRASAGKRVARAARTGGGRTTRGQTPGGYYLSLIVVVILGVVAVAFSRYQVAHPPAAAHPTLTDHWHDAFAFDICGQVKPNPPQNPNLATAGIHTHGDGLIHIEPLSSADTASNATLGRFVSLYPGMVLTQTSVRYPGGKLYTNGESCGSAPGQVRVEVWNDLATPTSGGHFLTGNPAAYKLGNGQLITIGFVPATTTSLPQPSSKYNLLHPGGTTSTAPTTVPSTAPTTGPSTTGPSGSNTSTTSPGATTSTTSPGATTSTTSPGANTSTTSPGATTSTSASTTASTTSKR